MDIKRILICDETSDSVIESLKGSNLNVDYASDISAHKILEIIHVSWFRSIVSPFDSFA